MKVKSGRRTKQAEKESEGQKFYGGHFEDQKDFDKGQTSILQNPFGERQFYLLGEKSTAATTLSRNKARAHFNLGNFKSCLGN
jgi:hypothetical protein